MPGLEGADQASRRREAERWCDRFEENTRKWLKSTVAKLSPEGEPQLTTKMSIRRSFRRDRDSTAWSAAN